MCVLNNYAEETLGKEVKYFNKKIQAVSELKDKVKRKKYTYEYFEEEDVIVLPEITYVAGDEVVRNMRSSIRLIETLSRQQLMLTEFLLQTLFHFIYGDSFLENIDRIKAENDLDRIVQYALLTVSRRMGKTTVVAWFVCCALLNIPNYTAAVFSPGRRQSGYFTELVRDMLDAKGHLTGVKYTRQQDNKETLVIVVNHNKRILRGLPAVERNTRGTTSIHSIAEEAAQIRVKFFVTTLLPISSETRNAFVGITTLVGNTLGVTNWVNKLMKLRDAKKVKPFLTYQWIAVCDKCIKQNRSEHCKHKMAELPSWHSPAKIAFQKEVFTCLGETSLFLQETMNIISDDTVEAFQASIINRAFREKNTNFVPKDFREPPKIIFISVDPAGGNMKKSHLALCSGFISDTGQYVIIGLESVPEKYTDRLVPHIINHAATIRSKPFYKDAVIIFCIENNSRLACNDIDQKITENTHPLLQHNVHVLNKNSYDISNLQLFKSKKRTNEEENGLCTSSDIKKSMMLLTNESLQMGRVCFMKDLVVTYGVYSDEPNSYKEARDRVMELLKDQLTAWSIVTKTNVDDKNPDFSEIKWTLGGKGANRPDDLAGIFQLMLFWSNVYYNNAHFQKDFGNF